LGAQASGVWRRAPLEPGVPFEELEWLCGDWDGVGGAGLALTLPHPRILEREFVLRPLCDLAADLNHPTAGRDFSTLLGDVFGASAAHADGAAATGHPATTRVFPLLPDLVVPLERHGGGRTYLMGILNVTPDSFSDGGEWNQSIRAAVQHGVAMAAEGADILDIGGESTRPGAEPVPVAEECRRVVPVIEGLRGALVEQGLPHVAISIDTRHATVAEAAVHAGAHIVNDVSGGRHDPRMIDVVRDLRVPFVAMHMRGDPKTMQSDENTAYSAAAGGVVAGVGRELAAAVEHVEAGGVPRWMVIADPGIGFSKTLAQNLELLAPKALQDISQLWLRGLPLLVGASRKGFLGKICDLPRAADRDVATAALTASTSQSLGMLNQSAFVRVHNIQANRDAARVMDAALACWSGTQPS